MNIVKQCNGMKIIGFFSNKKEAMASANKHVHQGDK